MWAMDDNQYRPMALTPRRDKLAKAKKQYNGVVTKIPYQEPAERTCSTCEDWHDGKGCQNCLACGNYKRYQIKSTPRSKIPVDVLPQSLLEAVEDLSDDYDILQAIRRLPDDLAAIISMHYIAGLSYRSIAGIMRISEPSTRRREHAGLTQLKKMFSSENTDLHKNSEKAPL